MLELEEHLGPLLIQLPPSLKFDPGVASGFFTLFRERFDGLMALEPRHLSWWSDDAVDLVTRLQIAIVAADPARNGSLASGTVPQPAGWPGLAYFRLHGLPTMYRSDYPDTVLRQLTGSLLQAAGQGTVTWCIFDNTAAGAALPNALRLQDELKRSSRRPGSKRTRKTSS